MTRSTEAPHRGQARERTALAWNRSGLGVVVCMAVLIRHFWPIQGAGRDAAVGLIGASAIVWAIALWAFTRIGLDRDEPPVGRARLFAAMAVGTVLLAIGGFLLAFFAEP